MTAGEGGGAAAPAGERAAGEAPVVRPAVRLRTLGRLELVTDGADGPPARVMGPSKPLALLAYLALAPQRRASRDRLVALLWSDATPERARSTLRQTVWALRQRLGDGALVTEGDDVVLAGPLEVDAERFARAVAAGALREAWGVYGGPFIPDFALLGGARFEHWADERRAQLAAAWQGVGSQLARQALEASRPREAIPLLRAMAEAEPARLEARRALLEALLETGDRAAALREAEALEQWLAEEGERPDTTLRALLRRVRRPPPAGGGEGGRRPEMVGREAAFAALLAGWRRAVTGRGSVVVMRAAAGLGKTRILGELQGRLEDGGAAVVSLRARRADRDMPYALAAALAAALATRSGAAGVSQATATALVELAPGLSNTFPRAVPAPVPAEDALRVRTLALMELLQAVADEAPVAVLVDDLHWGDDASRQLLASLCERVAEVPALLVVATRPLHGAWPIPPAATAVDLLPLSPEQLEQMLASLARGAPELLAELGRVLHGASGGIPLLVVAALDLAQERGWLRVEGDGWRAEPPERLRQRLGEGSVLDLLLRDLPADALAVLVALALVRDPLPSAVLQRVAGTAEAGGVLEMLEQRGLLMAAGQRWEVAHDRLADAALTVTPVGERHGVTDRLVRALLAEPAPSARTWQVAGRLQLAVHPAEAVRCFRQWMALGPAGASWRDPLTAASAFLGPEARLAEVQRLARSVPLRTRLRLGYPVATGAVVLAALMAAVSGLTVAGQRLLAPAAARMEVLEPNSSRGFLWDPREEHGVRPTPARAPAAVRITFRDAGGRLTVNAPRTVALRLADVRGDVRLEGTLRAPVHGGQAEFGDLTVVGSGGFVFEAVADGVPAARTRRFQASIEGASPEAGVVVVAGTVNGQPVDSVRREVRVRPGAFIEGELAFRVLTDSRTAAILFGGVALWGDRTRQPMALQALPPHGTTEFRQTLVDKVDGRRWRVPLVPGRYAVLFVADAETEMRFIASGTNWVLGTPRWNDGDDLADLRDPQLRQLERDGQLMLPRTWLRDPGVRGDSRAPLTAQHLRRLMATVLWVRVEAP